MSRRHPFQSCVFGQQRLVEDNLLVFSPQFSEPAFQPLADWIQSARDSADSVDVTVLLHGTRVDARYGPCLCEEIFNDFGNKPTFTSLSRFADDSAKVQLSFRQTLQRR